MRPLLAVVLSLAASSAFGHEIERESFALIGWNSACSVAVAHYGYPVFGQAAYNEPVHTRIGKLSIAPGKETSQAAWDINWDGADTWDSPLADKARTQLAASGYALPGFPETILSGRVGAQPGLAQTILSPAAFALRATAAWPGPEWRWHQVHYSPLGTCGLFVFLKGGADKPFYRYLLLRIYNASARPQRSRAHVTNSLLLLEANDFPGALAEAATAAQMTPSNALARYQHAAMLCLAGRFEEALAGLDAAVKLDPKYKKEARTDRNFEAIFSWPRFKLVTRG